MKCDLWGYGKNCLFFSLSIDPCHRNISHTSPQRNNQNKIQQPQPYSERTPLHTSRLQSVGSG